MKNTFLTLTFILLTIGSYAQLCEPDTTIKKAGIYPEYVDTAFIDVPFEHVFQILAVRDTTLVVGNNTVTVQVDSIIIQEINGLPGDFTYQCNPVNCLYTYEAVGCATLTGNPVDSNIGTHPLEIVVTSYAKWGQLALDQTDTLRDFSLVILDSSRLGLEELKAGLSLYPNPNRGQTLEIRSQVPMQAVTITDIDGKIVLEKTFQNSVREHLDVKWLSKGLHVVHIQTSEAVIHKKLMLLD